MGSGIPTGKTYLCFALLWYAVFGVAAVTCALLAAAGYIVAAMVALALTAYGLLRVGTCPNGRIKPFGTFATLGTNALRQHR